MATCDHTARLKRAGSTDTRRRPGATIHVLRSRLRQTQARLQALRQENALLEKLAADIEAEIAALRDRLNDVNSGPA